MIYSGILINSIVDYADGFSYYSYVSVYKILRNYHSALVHVCKFTRLYYLPLDIPLFI